MNFLRNNIEFLRYECSGFYERYMEYKRNNYSNDYTVNNRAINEFMSIRDVRQYYSAIMAFNETFNIIKTYPEKIEDIDLLFARMYDAFYYNCFTTSMNFSFYMDKYYQVMEKIDELRILYREATFKHLDTGGEYIPIKPIEEDPICMSPLPTQLFFDN